MRAIWSGAIGFGLVNIPVKIFSAVQSADLDLDMLDKKDQANIHYKRVNENTGREVAWENIVRGYKYHDRYVVLTPEDFEKVLPEKNKVINIAEFVDEKEIDSIYFETPYFLAPAKAGMKAYNLLRDALVKTGKAGLGSFVMRAKEQLCIIRPWNDLLLLNKIRFAEQVRDPSDIEIKNSRSSPPEMKMAVALIKQMSGPFDISQYKNTYTADLLKLIKNKAKGKKTPTSSLRVVHSRSRDLMDQLKESLGKKRKKAS